MKRNIFIALFLLILPAAILTAQEKVKSFTGTITYRITYPESASNPIVAALPTTLEMKIAGNKAMTELMLPFGNNTFIMNGDNLTVTRLVQLTEGKFFVTKSQDDFKMDSAPLIMPLNETKKIAEYNCKTSEINIMSGSNTTKSKVYYTEELGFNNIYFNTIVRSIQGIMLEFEYNIMGIPVQLSAVSVKPGRISNKTFEIPSGYTETTEAKLREMKGPMNK